MVSSTTVVPSATVLLNFDDETKVNNMLIIDTPKSVTEAAKEAKKAPVQVTKTEDERSNKKAKKESKTTVAQATPVEATTAATTQTKEEEKPVETKLEIKAISPETNKAVMEAIAKKIVQRVSVALSFELQCAEVWSLS